MKPTATPVLPLELWSQLSMELLWAWAGPVPAPWRERPYRSGEVAAWLVRQGRARVEVAGNVAEAVAGQWLLPRPGLGWQSFSDKADILSVRCRIAWLDGRSLLDTSRNLVLTARDWPGLAVAGTALARLVRDRLSTDLVTVMQTPGSLATYVSVHTQLSRWVATYYEAGVTSGLQPTAWGEVDPHVAAAVRILQRRSLREPLRESDLARAVGLSVSHLNRLFVRQFGLTTRRWSENRRIEAAEWALTGSQASMKEIAFSLGFSSSAHFCTWFRRHHDATPTAFREQARGERRA